MGKFDLRKCEPRRYARAMAEQDRMKSALDGTQTAARVCPLCLHKVAILYPGAHGPERIKCPACGEEIILPPVTLRRVK